MMNEAQIDLLDIGDVDTDKAKISFKNIGWSLGNYCPMRCNQCYSRIIREDGGELEIRSVDKIIEQLIQGEIKTVNIGGNEPIFTNGSDIKRSLLPYIIHSLTEGGVSVGITTAGLSLVALKKYFPDCLSHINDIDVSIDSPRACEHNLNRGNNNMFDIALEAVEICKVHDIPRSFIMCGMKWNFTRDRLVELVNLAREHQANVRINPIKPVELHQMDLVLTPQQFYEGLFVLLDKCDPVDLSDPAWASAGILSDQQSGCACGTSSFRINAPASDGRISVTPCVYLHDYKVGDLRTMSLAEVTKSSSFEMFHARKRNPDMIEGCTDCELIKTCSGGCVARSYLHSLHENGKGGILIKDPYCIKETDRNSARLQTVLSLVGTSFHPVHKGYLCTGIFKPRSI